MRRRRQWKKSIFPLQIDKLERILKSKFDSNNDLLFSTFNVQGKNVAVFYISYVVESQKLENSLLEPLLSAKEPWTTEDILNEIPLETGSTETTLDEILEKIIHGSVFVYVEGEKEIVSYILLKKDKRSLEKAETESLVLGPKLSFTESIITNLNIVRWRIRSTDLVIEEFKVGKKVPRDVRLVYMKSAANEEDVQTMRQRLKELDVDEIEDSVVLKQYLEDDQLNLFPQFESTELPDKFSYAVTKGRLGVLVENSPTGIIAPSNLFTFLESTEDLYMRWHTGSFLRLLRIIAIFFP